MRNCKILLIIVVIAVVVVDVELVVVVFFTVFSDVTLAPQHSMTLIIAYRILLLWYGR